MGGLISKCFEFGHRVVAGVKAMWEGASRKRKLLLVLGGGVTAGAIFTGGLVAQACFSALVINTFSWFLMSDSPMVWAFIEMHGVIIDWCITGLGFFFTMGASATLGLTTLMLGVYFSIFRGVIFGESEVVFDDSDIIEAELEGVWS